MPNGQLPTVPGLPGLPELFGWTPEQQRQLTQVGRRREEAVAAYRGELLDWEKMPFYEKWGRQIAAQIPYLEGWPGYGYTPAQAQAQILAITEEEATLQRQQAISGQIPTIMAHLTYLALAGEPITTTSDLYSTFPELKETEALTEEQRAWIIGYAQTLAGATKEEILSGQFGADAPISWEDIEEILRRQGVDPRFIMSTVAFSQDVSQIQEALMEAYPPQVAEGAPETELEEALAQRFREMLGAEEGAPLTEAVAQQHAATLAAFKAEIPPEGQPLILEDTETGEPVEATILPDMTVLYNDQEIGIYDPATGGINPMPIPPEGVPITLTSEDGEEFEAVWMPDDTVMYEGDVVGSVTAAGQFEAVEPPLWAKVFGPVLSILETLWTPFEAFGQVFTYPILEARERMYGLAALPGALGEYFEAGLEMVGMPSQADQSRYSEYTQAGGAMEFWQWMYMGKPEDISVQFDIKRAPISPVGESMVERYERELPGWSRMIIESLPLFAIGAISPIATGLRSGAMGIRGLRAGSGTARALGWALEATGIPAAERVTGAALRAGVRYGIGVPLKFAGTAIFQKTGTAAFLVALDRGISVTFAKAGLHGMRAQYTAQWFNLINKATLQRASQAAVVKWATQVPKGLTGKKAAQWIAQKAAVQTLREVRPLLTQAIKEVTPETTRMVSTMIGMERALVTKGIAPTEITARILAEAVPRSVTFTKPASLVNQLKNLGFSAAEITKMKPMEAWANLLSKRITGVLPEKVPVGPKVGTYTEVEAEFQAGVDAVLAAHPEFKSLFGIPEKMIDLAKIADGSLKLPKFRALIDMRFYFDAMEKLTGVPFYRLSVYLHRGSRIANAAVDDIYRAVNKNPVWKRLINNKEALARVEAEITSHNPALKVAAPKGLSTAEKELANYIEGVFRSYETKIRYLRFTEAYDDVLTPEGVMKLIDDAPKTDIKQAIKLYESGNESGLLAFLGAKTWGIVEAGYTPWMVAKPSLATVPTIIGAVPGRGRLIERQMVKFPEMERDVFQRLTSYVKQIETRWQLKGYTKALQDSLRLVSPKIAQSDSMWATMQGFYGELLGRGIERGIASRWAFRLYSQMMSAVFWHPYLAFRNLHQILAFYPNPTELVRCLGQAYSPASKRYYEVFVSQMNPIKKEFLFTGERGLPGLQTLSRWANKTSMYGWSDDMPRGWCFRAGSNKALRAGVEFLETGDLKAYARASGIDIFTETQRRYFLGVLVGGPQDFGVAGLRAVPGYKAAAMLIGHEMANMTHFVYERAWRAPIEHGTLGRLLFNLMTFPRSYFQRMTIDLTKTFGPGATFAARKAGFRRFMHVLVAGALVSQELSLITGRPRQAYSPLTMLEWAPGGLAIGGMVDAVNVLVDIKKAVIEGDSAAATRVINQLPRTAETFIPFYKTLLDSIETAADVKKIDAYALRLIRAAIDENYTPEQMEDLERSLYGMFQHALFAGEPLDPSAFDTMLDDLEEAQNRLGEMGDDGRFYTLTQLASALRVVEKTWPKDMLTEEFGLSELAEFYFECESLWEEYDALPSQPTSVRADFRDNHPEVDAAMFFWGYRISQLRTEEAGEIFLEMTQIYDITHQMHPIWAEW